MNPKMFWLESTCKAHVFSWTGCILERLPSNLYTAECFMPHHLCFTTFISQNFPCSCVAQWVAMRHGASEEISFHRGHPGCLGAIRAYVQYTLRSAFLKVKFLNEVLKIHLLPFSPSVSVHDSVVCKSTCRDLKLASNTAKSPSHKCHVIFIFWQSRLPAKASLTNSLILVRSTAVINDRLPKR